MKKIIYNGDISPCRIKVGNAIFNDWKKGDVKELDDFTAGRILRNIDFSEVKSQEEKKVKKVVNEEPTEESLDDEKTDREDIKW